MTCCCHCLFVAARRRPDSVARQSTLWRLTTTMAPCDASAILMDRSGSRATSSVDSVDASQTSSVARVRTVALVTTGFQTADVRKPDDISVIENYNASYPLFCSVTWFLNRNYGFLLSCLLMVIHESQPSNFRLQQLHRIHRLVLQNGRPQLWTRCTMLS